MKHPKWSIIILFALISNVSLGQTSDLVARVPQPVIFKNKDLKTWPDSVSAAEAFDIFNSISEFDSDTHQIITESLQKLQQHGITDIHSILSFCPADQSLGEAYFSQPVQIIGYRIVLPGQKAIAWPADTLQKLNNSFSTKIVKTPFLEFLLGADHPNICLKKTDNLLFSYNPMLHELFHFLAKDIFNELEDAITAAAAPIYLDSMISQTGGEFEAYKAGFSAEIKFFNHFNISIDRDIYRFFDKPSGQLINADGLKEYIQNLYAPYYNAPTTLEARRVDRLKLIQWQLQVLDVNVRSLVFSGNDPSLQAQFSDELKRLRYQMSLLSK